MLFLALAGLIAGLARGFSGFGSALIFIPLASAAAGPVLAAPLLMIVDGIGAAPMLPAAWREADRRAVFIMSAGAMLAVPVGTWTLTRADPVLLRWFISLAILALLGLLISGWRYRGAPRAPVTVGVGMLSGFLSGVAQIGGAPAIAYWLGGAARPAQVRANLVLLLGLSQIYTIVTYWLADVFTAQAAWLSLAVGPGYFGGVMFGTRMFGLASPETFRRICYVLIAAAAIGSLPVFR